MVRPWFAHSDRFGPEKILILHDPSTCLRAVVVVDNTAAGTAIGGVRMDHDVTVEEVFRLARAMTFKNAVAGLPHGGGKAGIIADPAMPSLEKEALVRSFARAIRTVTDYVPGPDMGVDETCMAYVHDEIGRAIGLPKVLGGVPLDTLGATGYGLAIAAQAAEDMGHVRLERARVVIQGFGAVGTHAARFLTERGALVVAVSDSRGAIAEPDGLDIEKLMAWKADGGPVGEFGGGHPVPAAELIAYPSDIWVPAARPDVFTGANAGAVQAKLILPGANIAVTEEAERIFFDRGVVSIPDFIANAGGVICGAVEYAGGTEAEAFDAIATKIRENTRTVLERSAERRIPPIEAATQLAADRVAEAMGYRRGPAHTRADPAAHHQDHAGSPRDRGVLEPLVGCAEPL